MIIDPSQCSQRILSIHGAAGQRWLERLPAILADLARQWAIAELLPPYPVPSYSYVAPVRRADGSDAVLKVGVPSRELKCQIETLRLCNGEGIARLFEADLEQCAMLMERITPGDTLESLGDDVAMTAIAGDVMRQMWRPIPQEHHFQSVDEWSLDLKKLRAHFSGGYGPFPPALIDQAEGLFRELLTSDGPRSLIHGDVNPGNILRARRANGEESWRIIDPTGVVGHPLYDVATFLNNLPEGAPETEIRAALARRADQLAERFSGQPGMDRKAILAWGQAHIVLAGWWQYEDNNGRLWEEPFRVAELYNHV